MGLVLRKRVREREEVTKSFIKTFSWSGKPSSHRKDPPAKGGNFSVFSKVIKL